MSYTILTLASERLLDAVRVASNNPAADSSLFAQPVDSREEADAEIIAYLMEPSITVSAAARLADTIGIDLAHDCDENAAECECDERHAPGDSRCPRVKLHTCCSHDRERLLEVVGQ